MFQRYCKGLPKEGHRFLFLKVSTFGSPTKVCISVLYALPRMVLYPRCLFTIEDLFAAEAVAIWKGQILTTYVLGF